MLPVLNGKRATPKWDTVSLKYKYKTHSVRYVTLQYPTGREFHQIFHQMHHYNEKYADKCISILMESIIQHLHTPQNFIIVKIKETIRMRY